MPASRQRFLKTSKLRTSEEFSQVFGKGRRSFSQALMVLAWPNDLGRARLGLAIAKKHVRRAVDRNQIKRIVRDDFRHHLVELQGLDVVVMARQGLDKLSRQELRSALSKHWLRLRAT